MSNTGSNNMENTRAIYVPQTLMIARRFNPKQIARDWKDYIKEFKTFLIATRRGITSTELRHAKGGQPEPIMKVTQIVWGTK